MGDAERRIVIAGGGPVGLEAALYGRALGLDVTVLEAGNPGEHLRRWGHVRLFSPFGMNASPLGVLNVESSLPGDEECLTGAEFIERYLGPLVRSPLLNGRVRTGCRVVQIGRQGMLKQEGIGNPARGGRRFRILVEEGDAETEVFADAVIDASGTFGQPNWMGPGGTPALGERRLRSEIAYGLEDILGERRSAYEGRKTVVIGGGHSAATTLSALADLIARSPETSAVWLLRSASLPFEPSPDDPLPARGALMRRANAIARGEVEGIEVIRGVEVEAVERRDRDAGFMIRIGDRSPIEADRVIANVGYGPDNTIYRELQVHECWATRGPMALAAELLGEASGDCLSQKGTGGDLLLNPEPNFFILGSKSYGKNPNFLLRAGLKQIRDVFKILTANPELDLYSRALERATAFSPGIR